MIKQLKVQVYVMPKLGVRKSGTMSEADSTFLDLGHAVRVVRDAREEDAVLEHACKFVLKYSRRADETGMARLLLEVVSGATDSPREEDSIPSRVPGTKA